MLQNRSFPRNCKENHPSFNQFALQQDLRAKFNSPSPSPPLEVGVHKLRRRITATVLLEDGMDDDTSDPEVEERLGGTLPTPLR